MEKSDSNRMTYTLKYSQILEKKDSVISSTEEKPLEIIYQNKENAIQSIRKTSAHSSGFDDPTIDDFICRIPYCPLESLDESDLTAGKKITFESTPKSSYRDLSFNQSEMLDRSITVQLDSELQNSSKYSVDEILASSLAENVRELRKSSNYSCDSGIRSNNGLSGKQVNPPLTEMFFGSTDMSNPCQIIEKDHSHWSKRSRQSGSSKEKNLSIGGYFAKRSEKIANVIQKDSPIKNGDPFALLSDTFTSTNKLNVENSMESNEEKFHKQTLRKSKESKVLPSMKGRMIFDQNKENLKFSKADETSSNPRLGSSSIQRKFNLNKDDVSEKIPERHHNLLPIQKVFISGRKMAPALSRVKNNNPICPPSYPSNNVESAYVSDGPLPVGIVDSSGKISYRDGKLMPLKVTDFQLSWPSVKLRTESKKSLQIKNTSQEGLSLRIEIEGAGYQLLNPDKILILQPQERVTIVINFYPTVIGPAIGKLIFRPLRCFGNINSSKSGSSSNEIKILLYAYGGNSCITLNDVFKGPVGPMFLPMGDLCLLPRPLQRSFKIYNSGSLSAFAVFRIEPVGIHSQGIAKSLSIQPEHVLINSDAGVAISLLFEPNYNDIKHISRNPVDVITLAKVRVIYGDEVTRQRLRQMQQQLTIEESEKVFARSLDMLWSQFPGEKNLFPSSLFNETSSSIAQDLLTFITEQEITLTLNVNGDDETTTDLSAMSISGGSSILFRTVCERTQDDPI